VWRWRTSLASRPANPSASVAVNGIAPGAKLVTGLDTSRFVVPRFLVTDRQTLAEIRTHIWQVIPSNVVAGGALLASAGFRVDQHGLVAARIYELPQAISFVGLNITRNFDLLRSNFPSLARCDIERYWG
jgi:hypothetical protein